MAEAYAIRGCWVLVDLPFTGKLSIALTMPTSAAMEEWQLRNQADAWYRCICRGP